MKKNENRFETTTPAIEKTSHWIKDISQIIDADFATISKFITAYQKDNPSINPTIINEVVTRLQSLKDREIGVIRLLAGELDVNEVADIFERINSKGVPLNQADFAMSKLAAATGNGVYVRKIIDYFTHILQEPSFYDQININDQNFTNAGLLGKISWAKDYVGTIYTPDYGDIVRTAFTYGFKRGKLSDLVALLSGRNFETRNYEQDIAEQTTKLLMASVLDFIDHGHFTDFVQIIDSTGFIDAKLIGSKNALNYTYAIFLLLKKNKCNPSDIKKYVSKWFVMSVLTSRYSASPESAIDRDIKEISRIGIAEYLANQEPTEEYWNTTLLNDFDKASMQHPYLNTFFAAQVFFGENGFLGSVSLRSIREIKGDVHHVFPYEYLKSNGKNDRFEYNQIANFVYMEKSTNIQIGKLCPKDYMEIVSKQARTRKLDKKHPIGKVTDETLLNDNLRQNCIPASFEKMDVNDYGRYLSERRKLMVKKIENYYKAL